MRWGETTDFYSPLPDPLRPGSRCLLRALHCVPRFQHRAHRRHRDPCCNPATGRGHGHGGAPLQIGADRRVDGVDQATQRRLRSTCALRATRWTIVGTSTASAGASATAFTPPAPSACWKLDAAAVYRKRQQDLWPDTGNTARE